MEFVAIDFETANQRPDSACQVAAVVVEESRIVAERSWFICPPSRYFAPINISIHGIRPQDVIDAPTMQQVWPELADMIGGRTMIAHNARFDMGVLVASLAAFKVSPPNFDFQCTRALARAAWPGKRHYGLKPLGHWLGISFNHHDALEDARCCAKVGLAVESTVGAKQSLEELESALRVARGFFRDEQLVSPRQFRSKGIAGADRGRAPPVTSRLPSSSSAASQPIGSVCVDSIRQSSVDRPLAGKHIVMLGPLRGLTVEETANLIRELGGTAQLSIDATTDFVVAPGTMVSQAKQLLAAVPHAASARALSERQFRALLPGGSVSF